jgi:hypothetical protein
VVRQSSPDCFTPSSAHLKQFSHSKPVLLTINQKPLTRTADHSINCDTVMFQFQKIVLIPTSINNASL